MHNDPKPRRPRRNATSHAVQSYAIQSGDRLRDGHRAFPSSVLDSLHARFSSENAVPEFQFKRRSLGPVNRFLDQYSLTSRFDAVDRRGSLASFVCIHLCTVDAQKGTQ